MGGKKCTLRENIGYAYEFVHPWKIILRAPMLERSLKVMPNQVLQYSGRCKATHKDTRKSAEKNASGMFDVQLEAAGGGSATRH